MADNKKQIWLRPDQVDLLVSAMTVVRDSLSRTPYSGETLMACAYTSRRLSEIIGMLKPRED